MKQIMLLLFNTMPKSGSVYIGATIAAGIDRKFSTDAVAHGFFPHYFLIPSRLTDLAGAGDVRQEHFDASTINLRILARFTDRIVLNIRDPRQATLSWAHHAARLAIEHPGSINYTLDDPPTGLFDRPLSSQLDHHLAVHLPFLVDWCRGWSAAADSKTSPIKVLIMRYEDFVADPAAYCQEVAKWWGFNPAGFIYQRLETSIARNFRKGDPNEWRSVLSEHQQKLAAATIGDDLMSKFGWEK